MSFHEPHEVHKRRFGRNLGVGLTLGAFILIVFGLTIAKVSRQEYPAAGVPTSEASQ
jgi:hypothetical protein